jgi:hypothetical protein
MPIEARQRFSPEPAASFASIVLAHGQAVDDGGVLGLLDELLDREVVGHPHQAQALDLGDFEGLGADGHVGPGRDVLLDDLPEIHPVELVAGEDEDQVVGIFPEMDQVAAHGVGRSLVPVEALLGLLGREDVHEAAAERVKLVGALNVPVQRGRVELRQQEDPVDVGVDAVADRDIDEPVFAGEGHRGLAALVREGGSRVPRPPPIMTASTRFWVVIGNLFSILSQSAFSRDKIAAEAKSLPKSIMCGIVGYVGTRKASSIILEGLKRLEYRGYDSAGLRSFREEG